MALLFGSEGNLGVITKAMIAIHPLPEESRYGSIVFRSFADGVSFLEAVRAAGALPASLRLVNNREFRFGQALRPATQGLKTWVHTLQRRWLFDVRGFDPASIAACTIAMEGRSVDVDIEQRLRQVILDHGGSLSHHHGVGKIRQRFLQQVHSEAALGVIRSPRMRSTRAMSSESPTGRATAAASRRSGNSDGLDQCAGCSDIAEVGAQRRHAVRFRGPER